MRKSVNFKSPELVELMSRIADAERRSFSSYIEKKLMEVHNAELNTARNDTTDGSRSK